MYKFGSCSRIDGLVRLKIERNLSLLSFVGQDSTYEKYQPIGWNAIVEFKTLLGGCDRGKYGQPVDTRLDVGGRAIFLSKSCVHTRDLVLATTESDLRTLYTSLQLTFGGMIKLIIDVPAL